MLHRQQCFSGVLQLKRGLPLDEKGRLLYQSFTMCVAMLASTVNYAAAGQC